MKYLKHTVRAFLAAAMTLSSFGIADDTDIYLGRDGLGGASSAVRPNIMFILDTSGSMSNTDGGTESRMRRMKNAFIDVLGSVNNVNVGLMRFHNQGGPVLYPVTDINASVNSIDFAESVSRGIQSNNDDAEEYIDGNNAGIVSLDDSTIELFNEPGTGNAFNGVRPPGTEFLHTAQVNDLYEVFNNNEVYTDTDIIPLGRQDSTTGNLYLSAFRFPTVDIPQGATIVHTELVFTAADATKNSPIQEQALSIYFQFAENADQFSGVPGELAGPTRDWSTVPQVPWVGVPSLNDGEELVTPDLSQSIQQIINQPGWQSGNSIATAIVGNGYRTVYSNQGPAATRPKLRVFYAPPGLPLTSVTLSPNENDDAQSFVNGGNFDLNGQHMSLGFRAGEPNVVGVRYADTNIPANAHIVYARADMVTGPSEVGEPVNVIISAEDGLDVPDYAALPDIAGRPEHISRTTGLPLTVEWNTLAAPTSNFRYHSPDLTPLVQSLVNQSGWDNASDINLFYKDNGSDASASRTMLSSDSSTTNPLQTLKVWYVDNDGSGAFGGDLAGDNQLVGLRFTDLNIPQGATITNARIDFVSSGTSNIPTFINIFGETSDNAVPFDNNGATISSRARTGTSVDWQPTQDWQDSQTYASPDLSSLVQEIVDQGGWCGGNSMAFILEGDGRRIFKAFEEDSSAAPRLNVTFDTSTLAAGQGCYSQSVRYAVGSNADDAEQAWDGGISLNGNRLDFGQNNSQIIGVRFNNVQVPENAQILEANIEYTSYPNRRYNNAANYVIKGQRPETFAPQAFGYANQNISSRPTVGATVGWSFAAGDLWGIDEDGDGDSDRQELIVTPSLAPIVQEIVDSAEWSAGEPMVFITEGTGHRAAMSRNYAVANNNGNGVPALNIRFAANLGDYTSGAVISGKTVRKELQDTIEAMRNLQYTPIVDTLWEAKRYFAGEDVHFGRTRGAGREFGIYSRSHDQSWWDGRDETIAARDYQNPMRTAPFSRLSHPDSYENGTINRIGNCTEDDPTASDCVYEAITGNPTYISPISQSCATSYLVLLTDGQANLNHAGVPGSAHGVDSEIGGCDMTVTRADGTERPEQAGERCGVSIASYLANSDLSPTVPGENSVRTFTIGFNLANSPNAVDYLKEIAQQGDGQFFPATDANDLREVVQNIIGQAVQDEGAFNAPSLSVNAFNRLFNRPTVYLSLFQSGKRQNWDANMKKFALCEERDSATCSFGEVIDKYGNPAVVTDETSDAFGSLKPTAIGLWSQDTSDGSSIYSGGAASQVPLWQDRSVYLYTDQDQPQPDNDPSTNAANNGTAFTMIDSSSVSADLTSLNFPTALLQTPESQVLLNSTGGQCYDPTGQVIGACLQDMTRFLLGANTRPDQWTPGIPAGGVENVDNRWLYTDALHSQPTVISYGAYQANGDEQLIGKLIYGTSDGAIRFINEHSGVEEWSLYPTETLLNLPAVMGNAATADHIYGVDGTPTVRKRDRNGDGIVDPNQGDFVHTYLSQRRGGRNIYAYNLTPDDALNTVNDRDAVNKITPKLLWALRGDDAAVDPALMKLGQTWSTPLPTRMFIDGDIETVLVFGGGYDDSVEDRTDPAALTPWGTPSTKGNAVYIVDANNGDVLWWASTENSGADLELPGMNSSFAADLTTLDSNNDGIIDRIYGVDTKGQIWRFDIDQDALSDSTGARLAAIGAPRDSSVTPADQSNERKLFNSPVVVQVTDDDYSPGQAEYDLVAITSGNRADPLGTEIQDRMYVFRDYLTSDPIELDGQGNPTNYPVCNPEVGNNDCNPSANAFEPLTEDDLVDVSTEIINEQTIESPALQAAGSAYRRLQQSEGWFFDFPDEGEKGQTTITVVDGLMYFTTFVPAPENTTATGEDACQVALGTSFLYAVDALTGAPVFEGWNGNDAQLETVDRRQGQGTTGPAGQPLPITLPNGSFVTTPTKEAFIPGQEGGRPYPIKTYWYEK